MRPTRNERKESEVQARLDLIRRRTLADAIGKLAEAGETDAAQILRRMYTQEGEKRSP